MNIGIYQSAASLSALEQWQNAVAQNITSSSSSGFRKREVSFGAAMGGSWQVGASQDSDEDVTAVFPTATTGVSYQSGQTEHTGRDLDVALQGGGFFQVRQSDGTVAYTRNGQFNARADHTLVTQSGAEVLSTSGNPITLLPSGESITIDPDGTVVQGQTTLGRLSVESFGSDQDLVPQGDGLFTPSDGATPTPVAKPDVLQGYREGSNVQPMREMVDLVTISRSYEANQKVITSADERGQKSLDALG